MHRIPNLYLCKQQAVQQWDTLVIVADEGLDVDLACSFPARTSSCCLFLADSACKQAPA